VARHYNATKAGSSKHKAAAGATKPPLSSQSMDMWSLGCVLYQVGACEHEFRICTTVIYSKSMVSGIIRVMLVLTDLIPCLR
jgi:hypothetical protein